jgi:hypothetical protein
MLWVICGPHIPKHTILKAVDSCCACAFLSAVERALLFIWSAVARVLFCNHLRSGALLFILSAVVRALLFTYSTTLRYVVCGSDIWYSLYSGDARHVCHVCNVIQFSRVVHPLQDLGEGFHLQERGAILRAHRSADRCDRSGRSNPQKYVVCE